MDRPQHWRLTILRVATHKTKWGDHDFCLSQSHCTDTDPTSKERVFHTADQAGLQGLPCKRAGIELNSEGLLYSCVRLVTPPIKKWLHVSTHSPPSPHIFILRSWKIMKDWSIVSTLIRHCTSWGSISDSICLSSPQNYKTKEKSFLLYKHTPLHYTF